MLYQKNISKVTIRWRGLNTTRRVYIKRNSEHINFKLFKLEGIIINNNNSCNARNHQRTNTSQEWTDTYRSPITLETNCIKTGVLITRNNNKPETYRLDVSYTIRMQNTVQIIAAIAHVLTDQWSTTSWSEHGRQHTDRRTDRIIRLIQTWTTKCHTITVSTRNLSSHIDMHTHTGSACDNCMTFDLWSHGQRLLSGCQVC